MFVTTEIPKQRIPMCRAAITSGTVDMPARSPPTARMKRISAGVSNWGPSQATYTPSPTSMPSRQPRQARPPEPGSYASDMSGKRGPSASSFGPTSGDVPCRFTWSEMSTSCPGRKDSLIAARGVRDHQRPDPESPEDTDAEDRPVGRDALVQVRRGLA